MTGELAEGSALVFVGGCDRSGTTIIGRLVAERAGLVLLPEAYFHAAAFRSHGPDATAADALRQWRRRSWNLPRVASDPDQPLARFLLQAMAGIHERVRGRPEPLRVVETTPLNIEIASLLLDQFPGSIVVHVVRDPRAVTASLLAADFGPRTAQECARLWKQRMASGLAAAGEHPDRLVTVRYEDAIVDDAVLDDVVARLRPDPGYGWEPERDLLVDHTSAALQRRVVGGRDPSRRDAWRQRLSPRQIAAVEHECRQLMTALGYPLVGPADDRSALARRVDTLRSSLGELVIDMPRRAVRLIRALLTAQLSSRSRPHGRV